MNTGPGLRENPPPVNCNILDFSCVQVQLCVMQLECSLTLQFNLQKTCFPDVNINPGFLYVQIPCQLAPLRPSLALLWKRGPAGIGVSALISTVTDPGGVTLAPSHAPL